MKEELVSFDTAKLSKEKGFDEPCHKGYNNLKELLHICQIKGFDSSYIKGYDKYKNSNLPLCEYNEKHNKMIPLEDGVIVTAPTQSLLQKWLREEHNIHITITSISQESWQYHITKPGQRLGDNYEEDFYTYEESLERALQEALKLI